MIVEAMSTEFDCSRVKLERRGEWRVGMEDLVATQANKVGTDPRNPPQQNMMEG